MQEERPFVKDGINVQNGKENKVYQEQDDRLIDAQEKINSIREAGIEGRNALVKKIKIMVRSTTIRFAKVLIPMSWHRLFKQTIWLSYVIL